MQSYNQFGGPYYPNKVNNYGQPPRSEINQYVFVNGIEGAKAYQIMPNQSIMLMDSDSPLVFMKTADALNANKIDDLQNKVNQLELQSALNGVVRYPNSFAYNAGTNPFCACGCNGYNGNI